MSVEVKNTQMRKHNTLVNDDNDDDDDIIIIINIIILIIIRGRTDSWATTSYYILTTSSLHPCYSIGYLAMFLRYPRKELTRCEVSTNNIKTGLGRSCAASYRSKTQNLYVCACVRVCACVAHLRGSGAWPPALIFVHTRSPSSYSAVGMRQQ